MNMLKITSFLFGYITITIIGEYPERVLNMASSRGIWFWNLKWVSDNTLRASIRLSAFRPLRHIARSCNCRFSIYGRHGLPFWILEIRRQKTMIAGAVVFLILMYMLSSCIWLVDVSGNVKIKDEEVKTLANKAGLHTGTFKWNINTSEMASYLEKSLPGAAWVGLHIDGTRAVIEIAEKSLPPRKKDNEQVNVIAQKNGLIKEMLVLKGEPQVEEGETVKKGQVLISGKVSPPEVEYENADGQEVKDEDYKYVHARGIVRARVWYEGYGECEIISKGVKKTGESSNRICAKMGDKKIIVWGPRKIIFEKYNKDVIIKEMPKWRNIDIPVEIHIEQYRELKRFKQTRSRGEAKKRAEKKAEEDIRSKIPEEDIKILNHEVEEIKTGTPSNVIRVKLLVEALEDIGKEITFNP
ncbi:MAG: sporulation protein YqfD [Clostridiales bacterium]|nr:sporulation protein YqfD [Clostridiales bacterium]MCF8021445.1 sporulation protein YqfD [Clostridiales bacterium]